MWKSRLQYDTVQSLHNSSPKVRAEFGAVLFAAYSSEIHMLQKARFGAKYNTAKPEAVTQIYRCVTTPHLLSKHYILRRVRIKDVDFIGLDCEDGFFVLQCRT